MSVGEIWVQLEIQEGSKLGLQCTADDEVYGVRPGGVAEAAGLQPGDRLLAVDNQPAELSVVQPSFQREARWQVERGWRRRRKRRAGSCGGRGWGCAVGRHVTGRCAYASTRPWRCSLVRISRRGSAPTPTTLRRAPHG